MATVASGLARVGNRQMADKREEQLRMSGLAVGVIESEKAQGTLIDLEQSEYLEEGVLMDRNFQVCSVGWLLGRCWKREREACGPWPRGSIINGPNQRLTNSPHYVRVHGPH